MDVKEFDRMIIDEHEEFINKVIIDYMVFSKGRGNPKHVRKCIEDMVRELNAGRYVFNGYANELVKFTKQTVSTSNI